MSGFVEGKFERHRDERIAQALVASGEGRKAHATDEFDWNIAHAVQLLPEHVERVVELDRFSPRLLARHPFGPRFFHPSPKQEFNLVLTLVSFERNPLRRIGAIEQAQPD